MTVLEFPQTLPDRVDYLLQPVVTRPATEQALAAAEIAEWREFIDGQLTSWASDPGQLSDDGVVAPSAELVQLAMSVAKMLRDRSVEPPDRIVPNGDGGIVFRWCSGDFTWSLELDADGSLKSFFLERDSLLSRHSLHVEPMR